MWLGNQHEQQDLEWAWMLQRTPSLAAAMYKLQYVVMCVSLNMMPAARLLPEALCLLTALYIGKNPNEQADEQAGGNAPADADTIRLKS